MDATLYTEYQAQRANGQPVAAAAALRQFIDSFTSFDSKANWMRWYLATERWDGRIRHEIYAELIFPVLLHGYLQGDLWCLRWLIRTIANLYTGKQLWEQIGQKSEIQLRQELVERAPEDARARRELVDCWVDSFQYSAHEWPAGILHGHHGASDAQCVELLGAVQRALELDVEQRHHAFIEDFATKVRLYRQRLESKQ
jgi:hypothetical protein